MGNIIAIISGKGGVGKTTTTANLGIGIALQNKKCIILDFDIGQRNLDLTLGLENRVVYNMIEVMDGEVKLKQALIKCKVSENLFFLAASQTKDKSVLESSKVKKLLDEIKDDYDYILLDAPAGIESGYEHTIEFADTAIVVVNPDISSIRDADRAIGILDSKSQKVKDGQDIAKYLIINRIDINLIKKGKMLKSDDILDILDIKLIGKVPEDNNMINSLNKGKPIILNPKSKAGQAYSRISSRILGKKVSILNIENEKSTIFNSIARMFH